MILESGLWGCEVCVVRALVIVSLVAISACGDEQEAKPIAPEIPAADLVEVIPIKGDGAAFNRHYLIDEGVFADPGYISVAEIQAFFESNPYETRSFLVDHYEAGLSAAEILVEAGTRHGINSLVLLVKLQVETGLVSKDGDRVGLPDRSGHGLRLSERGCLQLPSGRLLRAGRLRCWFVVSQVPRRDRRDRGMPLGLRLRPG